MPRGRSRRIGVLLLLALWTGPTGYAAALTLHLALDHHGHDDASHRAAADQLAASHGHRHPEIVPDHQHPATIPEGTVGPQMSALQTPVPETLNAEVGPVRRQTFEPRARPPDRLFYAHCSLLL